MDSLFTTILDKYLTAEQKEKLKEMQEQKLTKHDTVDESIGSLLANYRMKAK